MTTIEDTLYYADGRLANGQVVISWPAFQTNGTAVSGGMQIYPIINGVVDITLYSNSTAQPMGTYYTAAYEMDEGAIWVEPWIVPNLPLVKLGQVRVGFPVSPSVMISALQLTSAGASYGEFLGWNGSHWVPMYPSSINISPNTIGLLVTGNAGANLSVTGSPAVLGANLSLNVPDAGPTSRGVVNTGVQTFAGVKTFQNGISVPAGAVISGYVPTTRLINTTGGLTGGGDLSADRTLSGVVFGASGPTHSIGMVPDPGATLGGTRYLREDATWAVPGGAGGGLADPTTTLGDLLVRGAAAVTRLGVGTNGQVLTADSTQALGVKWGPVASGQTPWLSTIDGANHSLINAGSISINTSKTYIPGLVVHGSIANANMVIGGGAVGTTGLSGAWIQSTDDTIATLQPMLLLAQFFNFQGNVGINVTTPPPNTLQVIGANVANIGVAQFKSTGTTGMISVDTAAGATYASVLLKGGGANWALLGANGSAGAVEFWNYMGSPPLSIAAMVLAANGNVGIGIAAPQLVVDVLGPADGGGSIARLKSTTALSWLRLDTSASGGTSGISFYGNGVDLCAVGLWSGGTLGLWVKQWSASPLMVLTTGGKVGIGTTSPTAALTVMAADNFPGQQGQLDIVQPGTQSALHIGAGDDMGGGGAFLQAAQLGVSDIRALLLQPFGGNVGVGVGAASDVVDALTIYSSAGENAGCYLRLGSSITYNWQIGRDPSVGDQGGGALTFRRNQNGWGDMGAWAPSGHLGLGTMNPQAKLHLNGSGPGYSIWPSDWLDPAPQNMDAALFIGDANDVVGGGGAIVLGDYQQPNGWFAMRAYQTNGSGYTAGDCIFYIRDDINNRSLHETMYFASNRYVGINGPPNYKLDVSGIVNAQQYYLNGTPLLMSAAGSSRFRYATDFQFSQSPGGNLTANVVNTVTLTPVPKGINGSDQHHYILISGGIGNTEIVLITGGTATSGGTSGTITFTPAFAHSGAWALSSATGGIEEAIIGHPPNTGGAGACIIIPPGQYDIYASIEIGGMHGLQLRGAGIGSTIINLWMSLDFLTISSELHFFGWFDCTVDSLNVNRTSGWVLRGTQPYNGDCFLKNSHLARLQVLHQMNGFWVPQYQFVYVTEVSLQAFVNFGIAIKCGQTTSSDINQGSEIYIANSDIFGNDFFGGTPGYGLGTAIWIEDTDAVYIRAVSIGGTRDCNVRIQANPGGHGPGNHFFDQLVSDATQGSAGAGFLITGGGTANSIFIKDTWFASAGANNTSNTGRGNLQACGLRIDVASMDSFVCQTCYCWGNMGANIYVSTSTWQGILGGLLSMDAGVGGVPGYTDGIYINLPINSDGPLIDGCFDSGSYTTGVSLRTSSTANRIKLGKNWFAGGTSLGGGSVPIAADVEAAFAARAITGPLGGLPMTAGQSVSVTTRVPGARVGMTVEATPQTDPGDGFIWEAYISADDTVVTKLTCLVAGYGVATVYYLKAS
jgi:hypothetical protein